MSASAPEPAPEVMVVQHSVRTRLTPIGGSGKSLYVMLVCLALSIAGALASRSYAKGGTAHITSNAPGVNIQIDGNFSTANASGSMEVAGMPFGSRNLQIGNRDYRPVSTAISMGWLSDNRFSFQLTPIPLTLTVNSMPGAEVLLNGKSIGTANSQGVFIKTDVMPGDYDIQVTMSGYNPFHQTGHLSPPFQQVYAGLNVSRERIQQIQEEQQQAQANALKVQQLLRNAQQQFNSRQYQAALAGVEEALKLQPANADAQQLKTRIVQTINILK